MLEKLDQARDFVRSSGAPVPRVGVILGSGLGALVEAIRQDRVVNYSEIPNARASNVVGHSGRLVFGSVGGTSVAVMQGRIHYYEGHNMEDVLFLPRLLARLGCRKILVTNAAGGINPSFQAGDLMLISDHINFMGANPLRGPNCDELGQRFPDASEIYSAELRAMAREVAAETGVSVQEGVYLATSGPSYETPAEIRAFRVLGADAVGMSTVPEALSYAHMDIPVLGISCITNMAAGILPQKLQHDEVLQTTIRVQKEFSRLMMGILERLGEND